MVSAAIKQREIDERITLDDEGIIVVLNKMLNQRREALEHFQSAARQDLIEKETFEIELLNAYMPAPLSDEEVKSLVRETFAATGATSMKDMGRVMAVLKGRLQGRADMGAVSAMVKERLATSKGG